MAVSGNSTGLYVVGAIIAVIIIGVVVYYMARMMKGSMKLTLTKTRVQSGEAISGSLLVQAKRPIEVDRMYVALIGEREVRRRSRNGGSSTSWDEFYRDEGDIVMDEVFHAGFSKSYRFSLTAPTLEELEGDRTAVMQQLDGKIEDIDNIRKKLTRLLITAIH